jgi:hypothetical protein
MADTQLAEKCNTGIEAIHHANLVALQPKETESARLSRQTARDWCKKRAEKACNTTGAR